MKYPKIISEKVDPWLLQVAANMGLLYGFSELVENTDFNTATTVAGGLGLGVAMGCLNKYILSPLRRKRIGSKKPKSNKASLGKTLGLAGLLALPTAGLYDEAKTVVNDLEGIVSPSSPGKTHPKRKRQLTCSEDFIRNYKGKKHYKPHSQEAIDLFKLAAKCYGLPEEWAESKGLHNILYRESRGWVGVPNYTIKTEDGKMAKNQGRKVWERIHRQLKNGSLRPGSDRAISSATGLGQLLSYNAKAHYPLGLEGLGNPLAEAMGMLSYINSRYGTPENAWKKYKKSGY